MPYENSYCDCDSPIIRRFNLHFWFCPKCCKYVQAKYRETVDGITIVCNTCFQQTEIKTAQVLPQPPQTESKTFTETIDLLAQVKDEIVLLESIRDKAKDLINAVESINNNKASTIITAKLEIYSQLKTLLELD